MRHPATAAPRRVACRHTVTRCTLYSTASLVTASPAARRASISSTVAPAFHLVAYNAWRLVVSALGKDANSPDSPRSQHLQRSVHNRIVQPRLDRAPRLRDHRSSYQRRSWFTPHLCSVRIGLQMMIRRRRARFRCLHGSRGPRRRARQWSRPTPNRGGC